MILQGIVEAPATGDVLPRYAMPGKKGSPRSSGAQDSLSAAASGKDDGKGRSYSAALQAIWGRSLEKGAHFLDLALGAVSGVQGNQPVFRLHYSVLSGYLDVSS